MDFLQSAGDFFLQLIHVVYNLLWGDLMIDSASRGGSSLGLSLLVLILDPYGNLLHHQNSFSSFPSVSRNDTDCYGKEESHS